MKTIDACAKEYDINISSLEDKVYHSTRKVEELSFENELLKKQLEIAKEALEFECGNRCAREALEKIESAGE